MQPFCCATNYLPETHVIQEYCNMAITCKEVPFGSETYKTLLTIRYEVLRKPLGWELREKDIANDHNEFHLAAFDDGKAIGCVLLKPLSKTTIQLRQMAIMDSHRGKNIGAELVRFAEEFVQKQGFTNIETRARKTAEGFYQKLGYTSHADEFEDEHTLKMSKLL